MTADDTVRRYELACGHIFENTQILPAGTQLICKSGTGRYAGAHGTTIVKKLRNRKEALVTTTAQRTCTRMASCTYPDGHRDGCTPPACEHLDNQGRPYEPQPWAHASLHDDEPDECWATGYGQREIHDLHDCSHFASQLGGDHDCPREAFLDDPITVAYGVGSEMVGLIPCATCDERERGL